MLSNSLFAPSPETVIVLEVNAPLKSSFSSFTFCKVAISFLFKSILSALLLMFVILPFILFKLSVISWALFVISPAFWVIFVLLPSIAAALLLISASLILTFAKVSCVALSKDTLKCLSLPSASPPLSVTSRPPLAVTTSRDFLSISARNVGVNLAEEIESSFGSKLSNWSWNLTKTPLISPAFTKPFSSGVVTVPSSW